MEREQVDTLRATIQDVRMSLATCFVSLNAANESIDSRVMIGEEAVDAAFVYAQVQKMIGEAYSSIEKIDELL